MTSTGASKPDEYRRYAEDSWKLAENTEDNETKALFQLTAKAWTMLASQVDALEGAQVSKVTTIPVLRSKNIIFHAMVNKFLNAQWLTSMAVGFPLLGNNRSNTAI